MRWLVALILFSLSAVCAVPGAAAGAAAAKASDRPVAFSRWTGGGPFRSGERAGVRVRHGALVLGEASKHRSYRGTRYDVGTWTSPWTAPGFGLTQLVASWSAETPKNSWVEIRVRVSSGAATSRWQVLGRWASGDKHVRRTSVPGQSDALGRVDVDTWKAADAAGVASYQLQARLMRRAGASSAGPSVASLGAVASRLPSGVPPVSTPGPARGVTLDVPAYSQMVHAGELARYGGGGEARSSPTSTAMVLGASGRLPTASSSAWFGPRADAWVDEVARRTYDAAYEG